ncbi:MAG: site-2 protease family protein [Pyrobaculum sp.]
MDPLLVFVASWLAVVLVVYLIKKEAVRYFIAIYYKSGRYVKHLEELTRRLSFVPLRLYLAVSLFLALLPIFFVMPFIRPDGQVQLIQGFFYMLVTGTVNAARSIIGGAPVQEAAARSAGVTPIIPGVTLPWDQLPYIAVAIVVAVALHEFMHAYAAIRYGIPVKYVGVFSFFYVISGAFVEPDEEKFKKAGVEAKAAVLASGVAANVALAGIAMVLAVVGAWAGLQGAVLGAPALGLQPGERVLEIRGCGLSEKVYTPDDFITKANVLAGLGPLIGVNRTVDCKPGDKVVIVAGGWFGRREVSVDYAEFATTPRIQWLYEDGSLYKAGVRPGDVVKKIEGCGLRVDVETSGQLLNTLLEMRGACKPGDVVKLTLQRNGTTAEVNMTLFEKNGRIYYGLGPGSLPLWGIDEGVKRDQLYNTDFTRLMFWLIVVNYGLAVVNALPIYPLDGGQLFAALLQRLLGERRGSKVMSLLSIIVGVMLVFNLALGVLGEQYKILQSIR